MRSDYQTEVDDVERKCLFDNLYRWGRFVLILSCLVFSSGCAYRLQPYGMPAKEQLKIVATSPEKYSIRENIDGSTDQNIPEDGRLSFTIPGSPRGCSVYLFGVLPVSSVDDPAKRWQGSIIYNGRIVHKLSLKELAKLPVDAQGYHLLEINN